MGDEDGDETKNTIRALQDEFDKAELHADTATLQRLLADDFLSTGLRDFILDKKEWINRHVHFKYHKLETSDMDIRLYDKSAIVRNIQGTRPATRMSRLSSPSVSVKFGLISRRSGGWPQSNLAH